MGDKISRNPSALFKNMSMGELLIKMRAFIILFIMLIVYSIIVPRFFTLNSLIVLTKHVSYTGPIALGMTFVILTGGIDLSVGAIVGLCGMMAGGLINRGLVLDFLGVTIYFQVWIVVIFTLIIGLIIGGATGILITKFNVAPFIATLGVAYIARGFALISSKGATFPHLEGKAELGNTGFPWLGTGYILGIPVTIWIMLLFSVFAIYVSKKTPLGRHIFAIGGNKRAAKLSGVKVNKTTIFVYMFSGFCAAMTGLITASYMVASHPMNGDMYEMDAIAAVVLGGTSLAGGIGTIGGTIIGAFVISILGDGLLMMNVSEFWQTVIKGIVIVVAVIADQMQSRIKLQSTLKEAEKESKEFTKNE